MNIVRISSTNKPLYEVVDTENYIEVPVNNNQTLLETLQKVEEVSFQAPCGGAGTCGKCRVRVLSGVISPVSEEEMKFLSEKELKNGIRLACRASLVLDEGKASEETIHILIPENRESQVSTASTIENFSGRYRFTSLPFRLPEPSIEDQRSLADRIETLEGKRIFMPESCSPNFLKKLASLPAGRKQEANLLLDENYPIDILLPGEQPLGLAVDIGTTTIVVRMAELLTGEPLGLRSGLNAQRSCGADVISRINYALESPEHLENLRKLIVNQLNSAIAELLAETSSDGSLVKSITIAGNTTMLHLLLGVDPSGIASAPFIPVFTSALALNADAAGFNTIPGAILEIMPSVSAYVGADITAGMGVSKLESFDHPVLFIDIGTNGEMALAWENNILCCSTAAGPAFEGANISAGTGGIPGAIDKVDFKDGNWSWTSIDNKPPIGICGSGIIDTTALLIESGAAEYTGRMLSMEESGFEWIIDTEEGAALRFQASRMTNDNSITTANSVTSEAGKVMEIFFTQKDLREVQLAKAAIAGGIRTLVKEAGMELSDIGTVILAGGFGSYIDPEKAGKIGLLPGELSAVTRVAGNTSGAGAFKMLIEEGARKYFTTLASSCRYLELSSSAAFQDYYIDEMCFPEQEAPL